MSEAIKKPGTLILVCTTVLFLPCMLLAKLAAATRINVISIEESSVSKHRTWYANLTRIPGNLILGFRRAPVKVLSTKQWHERERILSNATVSGNTLQFEKLDGVPLSEYLADQESVEQKLAAVNAAMLSLFRFHLQNDSHGDASATNVMIHELPDGSYSATWFDFDVAHKDSVPEITRRADDLRALLFTSKACLTITEFSQLFAASETPYADDEVWTEFKNTMSSPFQHCDIFHLAQLTRARVIFEDDADG